MPVNMLVCETSINAAVPKKLCTSGANQLLKFSYEP